MTIGCTHVKWTSIEGTEGGGYRRCISCGLEEQPRLTETEDLFATAQAVFYEGADPACLSPLAMEISRRSARYRLEILRRAVAPGRLLEVGPGDGQFAERAANHGYDVQAVEHSSLLAELVRKRGVEVRVGTLESVDLPDGHFDAVASWHVIEHVPDPVAHLRRAAEVASPGGITVLGTPNARSLQHRLSGRRSPNYSTAHLRLFTAESLSDVLRAAGWEPVQVITTDEPDNWLKVAAAAVRSLLHWRRSAHGVTTPATADQRALRVQSIPSGVGRALLSVFGVITWLPRRWQAQHGLGNELVVVARKIPA